MGKHDNHGRHPPANIPNITIDSSTKSDDLVEAKWLGGVAIGRRPFAKRP